MKRMTLKEAALDQRTLDDILAKMSDEQRAVLKAAAERAQKKLNEYFDSGMVQMQAEAAAQWEAMNGNIKAFCGKQNESTETQQAEQQ